MARNLFDGLMTGIRNGIKTMCFSLVDKLSEWKMDISQLSLRDRS